MLAVFGPKIRLFMDISVSFGVLCACIAYLLYVGRQISSVLCESYDHCGLRTHITVAATLVLIPICWLKNYKSVAYFSAVGTASILFGCNQ